MPTSIFYRLPVAELVVSGTVRKLKDELDEGRSGGSLANVEASVVIGADPERELEVEPPRGAFKTYKGSFGVMADGRLSSASADVTGELGTVLKSVVSIAGAVSGLAALGDAETDDLDKAHITAAYAEDHESVSTRLTQLRALRTASHTQLLNDLRVSPPDLSAIYRARQHLALLDEQLVPLIAHFRTWRASKVKTTDIPFHFRIGIGAVPTGVPDVPEPPDPGEPVIPTDLATLWSHYGYTVRANWLEGTNGTRGREVQSISNPLGDTIYTRRPEQVELLVYQKAGDDVVCTKRARHAVVDASSKVVTYKLEKSWFGRRSIQLTFDANGFVATVGTEGTSGAASALAALAGAPEAFAGGVENATKSFTSLQAAGRASIEAETSRIKADVERREQRLLSAGLDATAADAVELKRLQQLQGILEAQSAVGEIDPTLVATLAQRSGGDLDWYRAPAPSGPPEPQVIRILMGEAAEETQTVGTPAVPPALT